MNPIQKLFAENSPESDEIIEKSIKLGADFLGGKWKEMNKNEVNVRRIMGGQSNYLFHVTSSVPETLPFLIRIHRQPAFQVFTDTVNFSIFSERGLGPKLYGFFDGGRLEEYIPSKTMDLEDVLDVEISKKIGATFPRYHAVDVPISRNRRAIQIMRGWLSDYQTLGGGDYKIQKHTIKTYSEHPEFVSVKDLEKELDTFEQWAKVFEDTVVYCHNDLACGNVLELDSTGEMMLIDWEFSSYNYRGFDIAMHLAETAIDYRVPSPPGVKFDEHLTDHQPNVRAFCEAYVDADNKIKNLPSTNRSQQIEKLMSECLFFWPMTHLFWAIWSMKNALLSFENGTDLTVASRDRLAVYFHLRPRSEKIFQEFRKN